MAVGTNYLGTPAALPGCEEDLVKMVPLFQTLYEISPERSAVLRGSGATRAAILQAVGDAVGRLGVGDRLLVYYSGHGTQTVDRSGDEVDGLDECLVPHDYQRAGLILDDTLSALWARAPQGSYIAGVFDACNSATAVDLAGIQGASVLTISGCVDNSTSQSIVTSEGWRGALSYALEAQLRGPGGAYRDIGTRVTELNHAVTAAQVVQYQRRGPNAVFPFPVPY